MQESYTAEREREMAWWRIFFVLTALFECSYGECNMIRATYSNGCVFSRPETDAEIFNPDVQTPSLNCSHLQKSYIDVRGFPVDITIICLANNALEVFNMTHIANYTKLEQLDLRRNKISSFIDSNVSASSIKNVLLSYNDLTRIPRRFCRSVPKTTNLDLAANKIAAIHDNDFVCLGVLEVLSLAHNPLKKISGQAFKSLSHALTTLDLSFTGLDEVPDFLSTLPKLSYLSLSNNKISSIPAKAFSALYKLRWLGLSTNTIARIDRTAFKGLVHLQYLDLTDNLIETLQEGVFNSIKEDELVTIEMYENLFKCDCSLRWLKLWTDRPAYSDVRYKCEQPLRVRGKKAYELVPSDFVCESNEDSSEVCVISKPITTNISISDAREIHPENTCPERCSCYDSKGREYQPERHQTTATRRRPRYSNDSLSQVDCSNAGLTELPTDTGMRKVRTLAMRDNSLETLHITDLAPYSSLVQLDLQGCELTTIKPSTAVTLPSLSVLLLRRNELTTLDRSHLASFPNLRVLDLSLNKFVAFQKNMFMYNRHLSHLYLRSNPLRHFDSSLFNNLDLYELSLRDLGLDHVPMMKSNKLTDLDIRDNSITAIRNSTFAYTPNLRSLDIAHNKISVIEPAAFAKAYNLQYIDLSENRITTLPNGVFKDLSGDLLYIEVLRNQLYCDCRLRSFKTLTENIEARNPAAGVYFICSNPRRMRGKRSDQLTSRDFVCEAEDETSEAAEESQEAEANEEHEYRDCYGETHEATAILVLLLGVVFLAEAFTEFVLGRRRSATQQRTEAERLIAGQQGG